MSSIRFKVSKQSSTKLVQTTSAIKGLWSLALEALFNEHYHLRPKTDVSQTFQTTSLTHTQARNRPVFFYTHMSLNLGVIRCNNGTIVLKKVFVFFHYYFQQDLPFHGFKYFCHKRQTTLCMKTTPGKINK